MTGTHRQEDPMLLSIGDLAAASGLSAKALRLYAESELLVPRRVDPFTGYRSYGRDQIGRARLIAALRGLGMGLARIRVLCDLDPAARRWELRSWWRQEQADLLSRGRAVEVLARDLEETTEENLMPTAASTFAVSHAIAEHPGLERPSMQDAVLARDLPSGATLLALADGFGDDTIAAATLEAVSAVLEGAALEDPDPLAALETAWAAAEESVRREPEVGDPVAGTTLTLALVHDHRLYIAHIGDTRLTLVRGGRLDVLTQDHTHVRSLLAEGRISPDEAATHPDRALLNRCLAADAPTAPDLLVRDLKAGDVIVLHSDGLHAVVAPRDLAERITAQPASPQELAESLVELSLAAGGPDNVGVAVAVLS